MALAMVISGAATSFVFRLVTRVFLGAITATAAPTVASLVGDFFPAEERNVRIYVSGISLFIAALLIFPAILTTNVILGTAFLNVRYRRARRSESVDRCCTS
jgi:MFS family permease